MRLDPRNRPINNGAVIFRKPRGELRPPPNGVRASLSHIAEKTVRNADSGAERKFSRRAYAARTRTHTCEELIQFFIFLDQHLAPRLSVLPVFSCAAQFRIHSLQWLYEICIRNERRRNEYIATASDVERRRESSASDVESRKTFNFLTGWE